MMSNRPYKTLSRSLLAAIGVILLAACNDAQSTRSATLKDSPGRSAVVQTSDNAGFDLGEDWAEARASRGSRRGPAARHGGSATAERGAGGGWAIVLGTFAGHDHERAANNMLRQIPSLTPDVAAARVHSTRTNSMVLYGSYTGPDDPQAAADLKRIHAINAQNRPVYPRAFLAPLSPTEDAGASPYALMSVRRVYPNVDPLYTLQIAAWTDLGTGEMSVDQIRRGAEAYVARLRAEGVEAYVHHNDTARVSVVTVGIFGRTAVDAETGLYSPEVQAMLRRFPHHLVNEELLEESISRRNPMETRPQEPRLVLVPR
jgi:hypothetical protein